MSIRVKVVLLVLPLIIAPLLLTGFVASLSARNGITSIATSLLAFKMDDMVNYANSQWSLLVENNFVGNQEYVDAARSAVSSYAQTLVRGDSELIFAMGANGKVVMSTGPLTLSEGESRDLASLRSAGKTGWMSIQAGGVVRVAQAALFEPFGWYILVTERRDTFYRATSEIFQRTGLILSGSLALAIALLVVFSYLMTKPLRLVVAAMREIMKTNDLSRRVEILYRDETGELGHSFNLMTDELDRAYRQIKGYALEAAVAQHKEEKIRNIFEKYVPTEVIDEIFNRPEKMLTGRSEVLAILFSDIRKFTSISEKMAPDDVVNELNRYFKVMVDIIMDGHNGVVDKYIGDAIMAFFGAPMKRDDDALQSVMAGVDMIDALDGFNAEQERQGKPPFTIGVGIHYGVVTIGNMGTDKKMNYTVIGDTVNLASRLEGLTKVYRESLIISESVARSRSFAGKLPCRPLDKVRVKGKEQDIRIYTTRRNLTDREEQGWKVHDEALELYYKRDFHAAKEAFHHVLDMIPGDMCSSLFIRRCEDYIKTPPPERWTGAIVMTEK
jgi:adenylate cyclase